MIRRSARGKRVLGWPVAVAFGHEPTPNVISDSRDILSDGSGRLKQNDPLGRIFDDDLWPADHPAVIQSDLPEDHMVAARPAFDPTHFGPTV